MFLVIWQEYFLLKPETVEILEKHLGEEKVDFLRTYCGALGRLTIREAAIRTGWGLSSGWRILREARKLVGDEAVPNGKKQRQSVIDRIDDRVRSSFAYGKKNGGPEVARVVARLAGCSTRSFYRARRGEDDGEFAFSGS